MAYEVHRPTDQIKAIGKGGMKYITVRDAAGRVETLYEAELNAEIGDQCLITRYKYEDGAAGASRKVIAFEEEVATWPGYEILQVGAGNDINNLP